MSATSEAFFVDTNILVYAYDRSAGEKHGRARALVEHLWQEHSGRLSLQVLQELYVSLTRKLPKPVEPAQAEQIIADLGAWEIYSPGFKDLIQAIRLQQTYRLSFWDAMILQAALQAGCQVLYSEDLSSGSEIEGIRIVNPLAEK